MAKPTGAATTVIVTVNWKAAQQTIDCVDSLAALATKDWMLLICENCSPDGSLVTIRAALAERYSEQIRQGADVDQINQFEYFDRDSDSSIPKIVLVASASNLGFAGGNNLALSALPNDVSPEFYWFLNNDTVVNADCLDVLVSKMNSNPSIGICGATLIYEQSRAQVQAFGGARYSRLFGHVHEVGQGSVWPCDIDEPLVEASIDYVSGASMFVSSSFLKKVGPMSEDYFLYYEELDWAVRGRAAGFQLGYASKAIVFHKEGAVLGSGKSHKRSALAEYYGLRNRLVFTQKFFPWALPTVWLTGWAQVARRLASGNLERARLMGAVLLGLRKVAP